MLRELPWILLECLIKAVLVFVPETKMTAEEANQEGPRDYLSRK